MNVGLKLFRSLCKQSQVCLYSKLPAELVIFQDDNLIICWHKQQPFPYEYTKPIPIKDPEPESVLKIGEKEVKAMFKKPRTKLIPEELAKITYTCKHMWYPKARTKRRKPDQDQKDRPYL